jgi:thiol-disulfide isomerase/thioredoxin
MKKSLLGLILVLGVVLILLAVSGVGVTYKGEGFTNSYGQTNDRGTFTMYYADWCPHCKSAKPMFKDFMGTGIIQVNGQPIKLRMVEEKEIKKGVDPEVRGYPSFLYSDAAGKVVEFDGPRNSDGFMKFLETQILS